MKKSALPLLLLLLLLLPALSHALGEPPAPASGSHAGVECARCHLEGKTADCDDCHSPGYNPHPVHVKPSMKVAEGLPLDREGLLRCATCHQIHGGKRENNYIRDTGSYHSRRLFCYKCHEEGMAGTNPHDARQGPGRCAFCHEPDPKGKVYSSGKVRKPITTVCRFCHGVADAGHSRLLGMNPPEATGVATECPTCHDPHTTSSTIYDLRPEMVSQLGRAQETNPHGDDRENCRLCHTRYFPEEIRATDEKLLYGGNVVMLCLSCHLTVRSHHPTGVGLEPKMAEKLGKSGLALPLDKRGAITCYTCHDNGCTTEKPSMRMRYYDRRALKDDLCWGCHDKKDFANVDPHTDSPAGCVWCHESRPMPGQKAQSGLITTPTMICVRCHDVKPHPGRAVHVGKIHQRITVDKSLPLGAEGEISCTTCHNPHYKTKLPASRLREKAGCKSCHGNRY